MSPPTELKPETSFSIILINYLFVNQNLFYRYLATKIHLFFLSERSAPICANAPTMPIKIENDVLKVNNSIIDVGTERYVANLAAVLQAVFLISASFADLTSPNTARFSWAGSYP